MPRKHPVFARDYEKHQAYLARIKKEVDFYAYYGKEASCTCTHCHLKDTCKAAYDLYNTHGDCVMDK